MSLKNTKSILRDTAEGMDLVNSYYSDRWIDTIDKLPCYIDANLIKSGRVDFEIDFKILDKVASQDVEFEAVQSDTLLILKDFFNDLNTLNLVVYEKITFEPIEENQLVGWIAKGVKVYDVQDCITV